MRQAAHVLALALWPPYWRAWYIARERRDRIAASLQQGLSQTDAESLWEDMQKDSIQVPPSFWAEAAEWAFMLVLPCIVFVAVPAVLLWLALWAVASVNQSAATMAWEWLATHWANLLWCGLVWLIFSALNRLHGALRELNRRLKDVEWRTDPETYKMAEYLMETKDGVPGRRPNWADKLLPILSADRRRQRIET